MILTVEIRWDEKAGLRRDAVRSQVIDVLKAQIKRRPAMKKVSTAAVTATKNFSQPKLTIGLESGGSIELVLRTVRNRGSVKGTESEHDSQGDACQGRHVLN